MKKDMQTWRGWAWPLGFAATIVVASSQSGVALPGGIWQADKIVHFLAFGLLATVTLRALRIDSARSRAAVAVLLVSLFGASDELHQHFTPGRSCDVFDWLADTLGAGLAVTLYLFWPAWRRLLEMRARSHRASTSRSA
jgi:VanZ family protein